MFLKARTQANAYRDTPGQRETHTHATRTYTCFPRSIHPISLSGLICTGTELLTTEVLYSTQYTEYHSTTLQLADVRLHRYLRSGGRRNLEGISHGTST